MPEHNAFRHQVYSATDTNHNYRLVRPGPLGAHDRLAAGANPWRDAGIDAFHLVHGTFTGDDALGLIREVERFAPDWGRLGRRRSKQWLDRLADDLGNYPANYQRTLQTLLDDSIPVHRFEWSSENLHTARARAALELLDSLFQGLHQGQQRVVLWGHSHAGNVFALLTNLLASAGPARDAFLTIAKRLATYESPRSSAGLAAKVRRVQQYLERGDHSSLQLSIVTFGTPVRYGWETEGYVRLLHVIHHRPATTLPETRVPFPPSFEDLWEAHYGDTIQQVGIAGTDFWPYLFSPRRWQIETQFRRLLQPDQTRSGLLKRLRLGVRLPDEGRVLLVDYPDDAEQERKKLWGHAIYTSERWLPRHLSLIADEWF